MNLKGIPQEIGIHFLTIYDAQDLALDNAQHFLPYFAIDGSQTCFVVLGIFLMGDKICGWSKPYL